MGLHHTAHYLKSKGRNNDTELVHMTKGEVKGLQALALRHGGSLTINPDTGLPEAGFLEGILPTVAGVAAGAITMNPFIGAAVAGGLTLATGGSLVQGIMSGIGAYGGSGLLQGLSEAGATQAAAEGASQAVQQQAVTSGLPTVTSAAQTTPASINAAAEAMKNIPSAMPEVLSAAQTTPASINAAAQAMSNVAPSIPSISSPAQAASLLSKGAITPEQYATFSQEFAQRVPAATGASPMSFENLKRGIGFGPQGFSPTTFGTNVYDVVKQRPMQAIAAATPFLMGPASTTPTMPGVPVEQNPMGLYTLSPNFQPYTAVPNVYTPTYKDYRYAAEGGIMKLAAGGQPSGPVERMSMMGQQPGMYPQGMIDKTYYATPTQRPASMEVVASDYDTPVNPITGLQPMGMNKGGNVAQYLPKGDAGTYRDTDPSTKGLSALDAAELRRKKLMGRFGIPMAQMPKTGIKALGGDMSDTAAKGGVAHLGDYSDGGRLLKGPGDGMSDHIPATIGRKQPARLADGEFVVPADVVSHLGNGSTDAGARKLYKMMDKIRAARTGKKKQAPAVKAEKYLPA